MMKLIFLLLTALIVLCRIAAAQEGTSSNETDIKLPTEPVQYEMRLGSADVLCGIDFENNNRFDQEAKILDATVEFVKSAELSSDPDKFLVVKVKTGSNWIGLINIETGEINFDTKKFVSITNEEVEEEYGTLQGILAVDSVKAKYIRGAIDGTITSYRHVAEWLQGVSDCNGEASILMLPK